MHLVFTDMPSLDKMYEKESPMYDVMTSMKKMMPEMMDAMTKAMQQPQQVSQGHDITTEGESRSLNSNNR